MDIIQKLSLLKKIREIKIKYKHKQPAVPYKLALSVTNQCNCHCQICHVWQIYQKQPALVTREMGVLEYEKFFKKNSGNFFWIAITGGEPFLRDDFADILNVIFRNSRNLILLSIVSNGILTDKIGSIIKKIAANNPQNRIYIVISIDGDEKTHESLRGIKGIYAQILETIRNLELIEQKYKNIKLRLETTISRYNLHQIDDLLKSELVNKYDISFAFAQESERYFNQGQHIALQKKNRHDLDEILRKILNRTRRYSPEYLIMRKFYQLTFDFFSNPGKQVIPCYSSWASLYLGPWGEIRPCVMMPEVVNIRDYEYDLVKIIKTKRWPVVQNIIREDTCPHCWTPCEAMQTIIQHAPKIFFNPKIWVKKIISKVS
ncbi:MAG: radical SAM protein [Candidatus Omnitrophota bacterium]